MARMIRFVHENDGKEDTEEDYGTEAIKMKNCPDPVPNVLRPR